MADSRILAAITRFMTIEQIEAAYATIFAAYTQRLADVTVITGKTTDGDSAQAQIVVTKEDFLEWMDCLEQLLATDELDGEVTAATAPVHTNHSTRILET